MWFRIAGTMAGAMCKRIEEGKQNLARTMSPQQLAEAERRAADRLKNVDPHPADVTTTPAPNKKTLTGVP